MSIVTPFRYPGAKNKLLEPIMKELNPILQKSNSYIDTFVGGGAVLLEVAAKYPKMQLFCNDKDDWIAAFWKIISSTQTKNVIDLLLFMQAPPTIDLFHKLREEPALDDLAKAYRAIFFNRTTFSGVTTRWSVPLGGEEQLRKYKIDCRYKYDKLKEKILYCHKLLSGRLQVDSCDFSEYQPLINSNDVCYNDPPYYKAGKFLYHQFMKRDEHIQLSKILQNRENWILSYDDHWDVKDLYKSNRIVFLPARYCIKGEKTNWEQKFELLITKA